MHKPRVTFAQQALKHTFHTHCHNLRSTEILAWRRSHLKKLTHICWLQSLFFSTHQHFQIFVLWKWLWRKGGSCSNVIGKALVEILQERNKTCSTFLKCIWPGEIPRNLLHRLGEHTFWMIWLSTIYHNVRASASIPQYSAQCLPHSCHCWPEDERVWGMGGSVSGLLSSKMPSTTKSPPCFIISE